VIGNLHVEQEVAPEVNTTGEVVLLFQETGSQAAKPQLFITSKEDPVTVTVRSGKTTEFENYTSTTTLNFVATGEKKKVELPIGGDLLDRCTIVRVTKGSIVLAAVSPQPFTMFFRRPETIRS